jgi:alcohol dehydrogenase (cytochrome c)/quinohemoprotein ethanol dehydrogenase
MNADGERRNISRILAYKIGGDAELPARPASPDAPPPPPVFGSEALIGAGSSLFNRNCALCHGFAAISGGALPDVRRSAFIASQEAFDSVVLEGVLLDKGMPSWAQVVSSEDSEAIRAFIVFMANQ